MLYSIKNLRKQRAGDQGYQLLIRNLHIAHGAKIAITGPSGCGKSTTLDILGLSLKPDAATRFDFTPIKDAPIDIMPLWARDAQNSLAQLRLSYMGYVLQSGELLAFLTAGENMTLTARLAGASEEEARESAKKLAERLGIGHLWNAMPATLSVGERQRVAIARALAPCPQIILADEPTAALDPVHAAKVMDSFLKVMDETGGTLVLVTHNAAWARAGGLKEIPFSLQDSDDGVTAVLDDGSAA